MYSRLSISLSLYQASKGKPLDPGVLGGMVDPALQKVDVVMSKLGLERVGCIFTALPRDYEMSSGELLAAARLQKLVRVWYHNAGWEVVSLTLVGSTGTLYGIPSK